MSIHDLLPTFLPDLAKHCWLSPLNKPKIVLLHVFSINSASRAADLESIADFSIHMGAAFMEKGIPPTSKFQLQTQVQQGQAMSIISIPRPAIMAILSFIATAEAASSVANDSRTRG